MEGRRLSRDDALSALVPFSNMRKRRECDLSSQAQQDFRPLVARQNAAQPASRGQSRQHSLGQNDKRQGYRTHKRSRASGRWHFS